MKMTAFLAATAAAVGLAGAAYAENAALPNDKWSYDDPEVVGSGEWVKDGDPYKKNPNASAEFQNWTRTTTTVEKALNPAERPVGTDRFDRVSEGASETRARNVNAADPNTGDDDWDD